ncbi:ribonuclease P protein component [Ereboglobus sp. PH5-5]|uniref:ribonuclease P protein component n=1 Tax=unclassified Ereboglobus TaxID=2626932 RepID=UPI0024073E29|nr:MULTISPECIES: ribonuclease P protein component [unclassified Ereboglobus]MDF9826719.1 ribonuclease P protein component [Ereboglobus sp. PH5-10]MDF9833381.1 ribonuclease P protein component [Ereboglobus sp. PH5-5]
MRFRPEQHVRRQRDFRSLREKGRRFECGGFAFWHYKRPDADASETAPPVVRVGVVASYAAVGNAVARARAKRRLREVFRQNQQLVPPGHDILLVARRSLNKTDFSVIGQKFADACRRAFQKQPTETKP